MGFQPRVIMSELVSCILATGDRPAFARQAIKYFLHQTYEQRELVVVDDGKRPVEALCSGIPGVQYIHTGARLSLGSKLNLGIQHARGSIIQKLDDDDYYAPGFLSLAVGNLSGSRRGSVIVAWDCFLVLLVGDPRLRFSGHGWAAGASLCFHRELWERVRFRDIPKAVDVNFIKDARARIIRVCAPELLIVLRHGANTWNENTDGSSVDQFFARLPIYHKSLDALVDRQALLFYESLRHEATTRRRSAGGL